MHRNTATKSFTDNIVLTLGTRIILFIVNLLTSILTARVLGPYDRGLLSMLFNVTATLDNFCRLGIYSANIYMIGRERAKVSEVVTNSLIFSFILGSMGIAFVLMFRNHVLSLFLWNSSELYLIIAISIVPFHLIDAFFTGILQSTNNFFLSNSRLIFSSVLNLLSLFFILVLFNGKLTSVLSVSLIVNISLAIVMIYATSSLYGFSYGINKELLVNSLKYGVKSYFQTMISFFHLKLDLYLLALFVSPSDIAFYAIGTRMAEMLLIIPSTIGVVLFPKLTSLDDDAKKILLTNMIIRHTILMCVLIGVGFFFIGRFMIINWYGPEYISSILPFQLIIPGVVMMSIYTILNRFFMSNNRQSVNMICGIVALSGNLILNIILIPHLGINGSSISSSLSYSLATILSLVFFFRETKLRVKDLISFKREDINVYINVWKRYLYVK